MEKSKPNMMPNKKLSLLFLFALFLGACSSSSSDDTPAAEPEDPISDPQGPPPPLSINIQSISNEYPGIYSLLYDLLGDGESGVTVTVEYTRDGSTWLPATQAGGDSVDSPLASGRTGVFHTFVWNAIENLGLGVDENALKFRISARDADETASPVISDPVSVLNSQLQPNLVASVLPNLADIQDQASSHLSGVALGAPDDSGTTRKYSFSFTSTHFDASGTPANITKCDPGCTNWKKDLWNIDIDLYVEKASPAPSEYLILNLAADDTSVWSVDFATLFAEFTDDPADFDILDSGNPAADIPAALLEEFVNDIVLNQHIGVAVFDTSTNAVPQFDPLYGEVDAAHLASVDEAIFKQDPRWSLTAGVAEAMLRTATAIEKAQGVAFGDYSFVLGDTWDGGNAALIGAIADSRVAGAAAFSAEVGRWTDLQVLDQQKGVQGVESFFDRAIKQMPAFNQVTTLKILGDVSAQENQKTFANAFHTANLVALAHALDIPVLLQGGTADPHFPLQLREQWFDNRLAEYFTDLTTQFNLAANFGHGMASPQGMRNWAAFAASVFQDRPRPTLSIETSEDRSGGGLIVQVAVTVKNPDPADLSIQTCWLRYGGDDDDDWRYDSLPSPSGGLCTDIALGGPEICYDDAKGFLNRNWQSVEMTTSGDPATDAELLYTATFNVTSISGNHIALFAEVEDTYAADPGTIEVETRSYTSSKILITNR